MTVQEAPIYCECTPIHETQYQAMDHISPLVAVAHALTAVKETEPLELDPLYDYIDIEQLNRLVVDRETDTTRTFSFSVDEWNIFVRDDGSIRVCDPSVTTRSAPVFGKTVRD